MRVRDVLLRGALGGLLSSPAGAWAAPAEPAPAAPAEPAPAAPGDAAPDASAADLSLGAYRDALVRQRLDAEGALGTEQLAGIVEAAEAHLRTGRRDEAIAVLAGVVESSRFRPLAQLEEGRAATFLLGDALGRAGIYSLARSYLTRLLGSGGGPWRQRAIGRLVELGLESGEPGAFVAVLSSLPSEPGASWAGDVAYLRGIVHERAGDGPAALAQFGAVTPSSRFWAQATYRAGLLEVERGRLGDGERHFCRIADPRQTPRLAPLFGGRDFFEVRDLSRLALGRVAHEQYRFDDARYYYHLVPGDSGHLPEALYEAATSRYEAKDYAAAHALLDELAALGRHHAYEDEAYILDAYVDLARCEFVRADAKLAAFLARYEPVLVAVRGLSRDPRALAAFLGGPSQAAAAELGGSFAVADTVRAQIRLDPGYARLTRQMADLDGQLGGLGQTETELASASAAVRGGGVVARAAAPVADSAADRLARLDEHTASARRLLADAERQGSAKAAELAAIRQDLAALDADVARLRAVAPASSSPPPDGGELPALLAREAALAAALAGELRTLHASLSAQREALAAAAISRFEKRLTRLVRRARAGRIETVLGRKRALELEVEALSQGFLPQGAVDSLDAARYLADDEEYWPFDGEDWEDEYVGGEGLR